jgi:hypothetical protein
VNRGDTFRYAATYSRSHLWVVTVVPGDGVLAFNATTHDCDESCVLNPGDHPFIRESSVICYRAGQLFTSPQIEGFIAGGLWAMDKPVSPEVLERIRVGAVISKFTKEDFKTLLYRDGVHSTQVVTRKRPRRPTDP